MDFFKKAVFVFLLIIFGIVITVKSIEPVIEKQLSQIFADRKISNKVNKELMNLTEDFTQKKEHFIKILVSFTQNGFH